MKLFDRTDYGDAGIGFSMIGLTRLTWGPDEERQPSDYSDTDRSAVPYRLLFGNLVMQHKQRLCFIFTLACLWRDDIEHGQTEFALSAVSITEAWKGAEIVNTRSRCTTKPTQINCA